MDYRMRRYRDADDYWRIRQFLRATWAVHAEWELNWPAFRFDYCRWLGFEHLEHFRLEDVVFFWEAADGRIAGILHPEDRGNAFLQVALALRTPALEEAMIEVAERELSVPDSDGQRGLTVWANEWDRLRQECLARRDYHRGEWPEYQRRRPMSAPIPDARPAPGYIIRPLGDMDELPARAWLSWKVFHPAEPDEHYMGWDWYPDVQRAPLYRRDLDLVAVAPDGELAAFCTVWFDDVTRWGAFEPVGTHPAHQRRGLGRAVMCEGLRRLARLGATHATVGSYSTAAHALYESVGFCDYARSERWTRRF